MTALAARPAAPGNRVAVVAGRSRRALRQRLRERRHLVELPPLILPNRAHATLRELTRLDHLDDAPLLERSLGRTTAVQIEHGPVRVDRPRAEALRIAVSGTAAEVGVFRRATARGAADFAITTSTALAAFWTKLDRSDRRRPSLRGDAR